jgi:ABC-type enterochelin transport system substrate-binding protein
MTRLTLVFASVALSLVTTVAAQSPPVFSGTWVLNTAKSQNLGMMAALEDAVTISQTPTRLVITDTSSFQGQKNTRELQYDLTGKPTTNDGPMGDKNETVATWRAGTLVSTWTSHGAVAGTKVVRTETRSLSADGKTMTLQTVRGNNPPVIMVFDRK